MEAADDTLEISASKESDRPKKQMKEKYAHFQLEGQIPNNNLNYNNTNGQTNNSIQHTMKRLNLSSIIKASQTLSEEIVFTNLLKKIMRIIIENAGAQKGYFILSNNNILTIEAMIQTDNNNKTANEVKILQSVPLAQQTQLIGKTIVPEILLRYVARTHKVLLIGNAQNAPQFVHNNFIQKHKVKSLLFLIQRSYYTKSLLKPVRRGYFLRKELF